MSDLESQSGAPRRIVVLGGGTAGLVAALMLEALLPCLKITLVRSKRVGIVGVGEGSTEHFAHLMATLRLAPSEILRNCAATLKAGVYFEGFSEAPFFHSLDPFLARKHGEYDYVIGGLIAGGVSAIETCDRRLLSRRIPCRTMDDGTREYLLPSQFHFHTFALNEYFARQASERGIDFIDADVVGLDRDSLGHVTRLRCNDERTIEGDFFLDCSGHRRVLLGELGVGWRDLSSSLLVDAALTFRTTTDTNPEPFTHITGMRHGWMWSAPTRAGTGNGYVFSSQHATPEQIMAELAGASGRPPESPRLLRFDVGQVERFWEGNVVGCGLAAGFIEPLEATSIGSTIQQLYMLAHLLPSFLQTGGGEQAVTYNRMMRAMYRNIHDFVRLHYVVQRRDTVFWRDATQAPLSEGQRRILDIVRRRLLINQDVDAPWRMFSSQSHNQLLHGLGLIDVEAIAREFRAFGIERRFEAERSGAPWVLYDESEPHSKVLDRYTGTR